ncbi:hypothetical protein JKF63_03325 [Porcisia hertigi]|uniref:Uncharacterized protein n=1 Tax=Porcisia hertigi TaxID=2761500 RepID=A0A836HYS2_9TRYP|nr:hypothetical protein JKF63_03325 [Porcisia hertigi]
MEVILSPFFVGATCALVDSHGAELAISRAFASAANAYYKAQPPHQPWNQPHPERAHVPITVQLRINTPLLTWTRQAKDVVLRCVDRAVTRICPPLDVLQYISADSPAFVDAGANIMGEGEGPRLSAVFLIQPSAALWPASLLKQHAVEGEVMSSAQPHDSEVCAAAARQSMHDTLLDMDLWNRARAAHQHYDASVALDGGQQHIGPRLVSEAISMDPTVALQAERQASEKTTQLRWQLARWLTELFLNEGSWARSQAAPSVGISRSPYKGPVEAATRRLFQGSLRWSFSHVVDAALSTQHTTSQSTSPGPAMPRRLLHADVRGVEWDGLLVGYTSRYAYIAVPYFVVPAETTTAVASSSSSSLCLWSFVSRIPIPSILSKSAGAGAEDQRGLEVGSYRKRPRTSGSHQSSSTTSKEDTPGSTAARRVLAHCFNTEEVMCHENNPEAEFRLADTPSVVTVRSHRVYCAQADPTRQPLMHPAMPSSGHTPTMSQSAASPYTLSLVLEDAYVVQMRSALGDTSVASASSSKTHWAASLLCGHVQPQSPEDDGGNGNSVVRGSVDDTIAHAVHTFLDVVSVVRESCHRFQRTHERFCSLYAECVRVRGSRNSTAAVPGETNPERSVTDGSLSTTTPASPAPAKVPVAEGSATRGVPSLTVAVQSLRLLHQAEVLYGALSNSVSVHFKKLRGAARVSIPAVRTAMDVAQLEECHNVEFKAKVGLVARGTSGHSGSHKQHHSVLMDTERLRNTMAAMAACRGGVILLGVTDDGRIIGHAKQLDVARQLRTSGFCPAMVKDTVQVKELRWLGAGEGEGSGSAASPSLKRAMPLNWWKRGATPTASDPPKTSTVSKTGAASGDQVITVVSVQKGQAPFYATARNSPPYQRGCASTTVMPTMVMARRIMKELS